MNTDYSGVSGSIFNIQRFCVDDGPGIRTTVFLKGCPLSCAWCHNPESQNPAPQMLFSGDKCVGCGRCAAVCSRNGHELTEGHHFFHRDRCITCGECAQACYRSALELCGKKTTVGEVMATVLRDKAFYRNGGGLTLSGGEPMMQPTFSLALCRTARTAGLHIAMETSGFAAAKTAADFGDTVDLFLFDFKHFDREQHKKYTGVYNDRILANLKLLSEKGAHIILRCPIIPGVNNTEAHFSAIAEVANTHKGIEEVHLLPYHPLGISKNQRLGQEADYNNPDFLDKEKLEGYMSFIRCRTDVTVRQP